MSKGEISGCSYLNKINSSSSYLTNQALRRIRHLHTSIATQKWRSSRVKDSSNVKKCLADLNPRAQAFAISLGPVSVPPSPIKCEPCVYSTREARVTVSRDSQRVASSRELRSRGSTRCSRCHNGIHRDQTVYSSTTGVHCVNIGDISGDNQFTVIPSGAFIPRRRVLTQKPSQGRCKWTENLDLPLDELRLDQDETGRVKSPDVTKTPPSVVLTKSDHVYTNVRQTLDVKHVRLKTPPPSPSVRHINVHLPASKDGVI